MIEATKQYTKHIRNHLHCNRKFRKELLIQFQSILSIFLEDHPAPTYAQLVDAFGPPEETAKALMMKLPESSNRKYLLKLQMLKFILAVVSAIFIGFTIFTYFLKDVTVITVVDELVPGIPTSQEVN